MTAIDKSIALEKQEMKRFKLKRCALCTNYKEILFPQIIKVNEKTFNIIKNSADEDTKLLVLDRHKHIPVIDKVVDDVTLKLIDGYGYKVNLDICQDCLAKIGHRHKYKKNPYTTA